MMECYVTEVERQRTSHVGGIGRTAAAAAAVAVDKVAGIHEVAEAELGAEVEE